ncbi:MAG: transposase, partial [Bacteroidota bacterium]
MSSFPLLIEDSEKVVELPRNSLRNILIICEAMLKSGSTNLNTLKDVLPEIRTDKVRQPGSDYKFLTRFFDQGKLKDEADAALYEELMKGIQALCWLVIFSRSLQYGVGSFKYLVLDGTKWEQGDDTIHLMTLCVLVGEVAVPIWWEDLQKAGHSSQTERMEMVQAAMQRYQLQGMTLLADREYIGIDWLTYLKKSGLSFVIRVKEGIYHEAINAAKGADWASLKRRAKTKPKGKKVSKRICLDGLELHYIILKNPRPKADDELIFLLSNLDSPAEAARLYELRWQIEVCFKHLKSNGFKLEEMNVKGKEKRHLMMAMVVLAYCLAIREGLIEAYRNEGRWILDKATGWYYRAVSIFRMGLSIIRRKA